MEFKEYPQSRIKTMGCLLLVTLLTVTVAAMGPPRYVGDGKYHQVARVNHTKKLLCPVEADPPPMIQWTKDGDNIHELWSNYKILNDGSLRIRDIDMDNAGKFVCKATNGFGYIYINYTLVVVDEEKKEVSNGKDVFSQVPEEDYTKESVPPKFSNPEKMKRHIIERPVGSTVRLKCKAFGNPRPHIHWLKDKHLYERRENQRPSWTLKLPDLQERDSGLYTCVVRNRLGSINFTYHLQVIEKMRSKPVLLAPHPLNTTVNYGETASLKCKIDSDMQPHIQWLKRVENPSLVTNNSNTIEVGGQLFLVLKTGDIWSGPDGTYLNKMVVHRATEADSGMYICLGANTMGYSYRSAFLTVRNTKPKFSYTADNSTLSLPVMIGVPASILVIVIIVAVVFVHRRRKAQSYHQGSIVNSTHFNRIPTQDPEPFVGHSNEVKTNIHVNPIHGPQHKNLYTGVPSPHHMLSSREMLSKNSQSIDFYTDISSVSQSHHNHHHHMQPYSYN